MLRSDRPVLGGRSREERGAIAVISGIVAVVLLLVGALVIDLGSTWMRRGQLQIQADKAALLAARSLPVSDNASKLKAARYVAYYIACHVVYDQKQLHPEIPACPSGTTPQSTSIGTYAQQLLGDGSVTFPESTQIKVVTPQARIDYGFGKVAGVDGRTERKIAVAEARSPGSGPVPAGLSVPCILSAAANVPAGGDPLSRVLPINYITPGPLTPEGAPAATSWPLSYDTAPSNAPVASTISTVPDPVVSGGAPATFTLTGSNWGSALASAQVYFHKGPNTNTPAAAASLNLPVVDLLTGTATVTGVLPAAVMDDPGTWEVKIGVQDPLGTRLWSNALTLQVTAPAGMTEAIGCGRLLDSPRADTADPAVALVRNFQIGLDHPLASHPNLLSVTAPTLSPDQAVATASDPANLFACSSSAPHVLDVPNPAGTPNCVRLHGTDPFVGPSFTEGVLGAESGGRAGRLVCSSTRPCTGPTATVRGVQINDDTFDQFITDSSLLGNKLFFGLSTYVTNGLPVVTPQDALSPDLYKSHRFMWVPVMSAPATPTSGGDYPVLTFRPIFVTQDAPTGWTPYDMLWDELSSVLASLGLSQSNVQHGLYMSADGLTLRGMRFMTIEPASLPLVPDSYDGPTTEYVGVGPKLVRLVK